MTKNKSVNSCCQAGFRVVNRVVDSLDVRVLEVAAPSEWLKSFSLEWQEHLDTWEPGDPDFYVEIPSLGTFKVLPDRRPYSFVLRNLEIADIRVWSPSKWPSSWPDTGQFYISFRSKFLQFTDLVGVQAFIDNVLALMTQPVDFFGEVYQPYRRIVRVDLAVDTVEPRGMDWAELDRYVCRARARDVRTDFWNKELEELMRDIGTPQNGPPTRQQGGRKIHKASEIAQEMLSDFAKAVIKDRAFQKQAKLSWVKAAQDPQTVYFGRYGSDQYCRRYNKLLSLPVHNKLYMLDVWAANGWDGQGVVWRTEFSLTGKFLRKALLKKTGERDLRELDVFWSAIPEIWHYLTHDWMRHADPSDDTNASRWPTSTFWRVVQAAWESSEGILRVAPIKNPDVRMLYKQVVGCMARAAAIVANHDEDLGGFYGMLEDLQNLEYDHMFLADMQSKRRELSLDDNSDASVSAYHRYEILRLGLGS